MAPDVAKAVSPQGALEGSLGGVSLDQLGISFADLAPGGRFAQGRVDVAPADLEGLSVAHDPEATSPSSQKFTGNPTQGWSLYNSRPPSQWPKGKTFQNWQWPVRVPPGMPILEIVTNRIARSIASQKYYLTDGVCGPAVDILSEFPLNRGFDITVTYNSEEIPLWFPIDQVDPDSLVDAEGNSQVSVVVGAYVKARCEELVDDLNLVYEMIDFQKEAYVHGDSFINRVDDVQDGAYQWDHTREYPENTIAELQGLNPTAVWLIRNEVGETERGVIVKQAGADATDLDLARLIHLKHKGSSYTTYGFPHTMRALKELMVKEAYLNAAQAWGERYALPIRLLKYGMLVRAGENSGPVATPQMRAAAEAAMKGYDPAAGQTLVVPFHWEYQFVGAEGSSAMMVSNEILEANRRILAALGVPSAFLMGDWTNYATARIQYSGLMHRLKSVQENLRRILERRIFLPFCVMRGYVDNTGQPIRVQVTWKRGHLEDDQGMWDFVAKIAAIPGVLSLETMREMLGQDNQVEEQRLDQQADRIARRMIHLRGGEQVPSQTPEQAPPGVIAPPEIVSLPTAEPSYDEQLRQQVILRRIQEGLERVQDRLSQELTAAYQHLSRASLVGLERDLAGRTIVRRVQTLRAVETAYKHRLTDARRRLRHLKEAAQLPADTARANPNLRSFATPLSDDPEPAAPTGAMVAFFIPEPVNRVLALPEGEPPDQLHLTLAYLGLAEQVAPYQDAILAVLAQYAATAPLEGRVAGLGRFTGSEEDGTDAFYASVDMPGLAAWRSELVAALGAAGVPVSMNHDFTPHITLMYVPSGSGWPVDQITPASFPVTAVSLVVAGERTDVPLTPLPEETV